MTDIKPKHVVVYNIKPSKITKESVMGKYVCLLSSMHKSGMRKIHLEKHGVVVETIDPPEHITKNLQKEMFWVKLDNGCIIPSTQVFIVDTNMNDLINKFNKPKQKKRNPNNRLKHKTKSENFTHNFLYAFFKLRRRDILSGWEDIVSKQNLFDEVKEYSDDWSEENIKLFDNLFIRFLSKIS
jgi:hypothetical protein